MAWPEMEVRDWTEFTKLADTRGMQTSLMHGNTYIFRGQSQARWDLSPSLARELKGLDPEEVFAVENGCRRDFRSQALRHFDRSFIEEGDDLLDWWTMMQHYRAPTRLLDWTASPYVAAYFAVRHDWDRDGCVWCYSPSHLDVIMCKKHPVEEWKPGHTICLESKLLQNPASPPRVVTFSREQNTDRMIAQQGSFTVCFQPLRDHAEIIGDALGELGGDVLAKIVIPPRLKPEFLRRLKVMNIGANSLFPGIDGVGDSIAERMRLHRHPILAPPFEPAYALGSMEMGPGSILIEQTDTYITPCFPVDYCMVQPERGIDPISEREIAVPSTIKASEVNTQNLDTPLLPMTVAELNQDTEKPQEVKGNTDTKTPKAPKSRGKRKGSAPG